MTRENFKNLKAYLATNLHNYDLNETIEYLIDAQIPPDQRQQMYQSYESKYANEDLDDEYNQIRDLYIVTHYFLKMKHINLCKLLFMSQQRDQN